MNANPASCARASVRVEDTFAEISRHLQVEIAEAPDTVREAQMLRHQVFRLERNILPSTPAALLECDEFDDRARHVLLRDRHTGQPVGTARVVTRASGSLPMFRYCDKDLLQDLPASTTGEISRFALSREWRPSGGAWDVLIRLALMQGILQASIDQGLTHWCALMEPSLLRLLRATGVHFVPVGPMVEACGKRQPAVASIEFVLASGRRSRPDFHSFVSAGAGSGSSRDRDAA